MDLNVLVGLISFSLCRLAPLPQRVCFKERSFRADIGNELNPFSVATVSTSIALKA